MPVRLITVKLQGTLTDGSPIAIPVTARTRRLRLYKHELAALDFAGIAAATPLEILESGYDPITVASLGELAACRELAQLSLCVPGGTDLAPLAGCAKLRYLGLSIHGDCDLGFLAKLPRLDSLSISLHGAHEPLDVAPLRALDKLASLSLSGIVNRELDLGWVRPCFTALNVTAARALARLDLAPLAATALRYLHLQDCPALAALVLDPLRGVPLERFTLQDVGVTELWLTAFSGSTTLVGVRAIGTQAGYVDVTPLAGIATLKSLDIDGTRDAPWLSANTAVASPAVRAWKAAGRLSID